MRGHRSFWGRWLFMSAVFCLVAQAQAQLQLPGLPLPPVPVQIPGLEGILQSDPPITTNIEHATTAEPQLDSYNPEGFLPLESMPRSPEGGFYLQPGVYALTAQSYCMMAGTYAPSSAGPGYLYAPLMGPRENIVKNLLERSVAHPEVAQRDIQLLIWAIISQTKFSDMGPDRQRTAATLLTPEELFELNGGALGLIPPELMRQAFNNLPPVVRRIFEAEAQLRRMLTQANATFADIERVAILAGSPPAEDRVRDVPTGRWSYHPEGYYIRFFPSGYSRTRVEIYVPETSEQVHFNPAVTVAVPGYTSAQRLAISGRSH